MPDQALMEGSGGSGTSATPAPAPISFSIDEVPALFKDPEFTGAAPEDRTAMLDTVLHGAYQTAAQDPAWDKEAYVAFGYLAKQAHEKAGATAWEKTKALLGGAPKVPLDIGRSLYDTGAAGMDELESLAKTGEHSERAKTAKDMLEAQTGQWDAAAAEKFHRVMSDDAKPLDDSINNLLDGVDKGEILDNPASIKEHAATIRQAQLDNWERRRQFWGGKPVQTEVSADGNTVSVRGLPENAPEWQTNPGKFADANSVLSPDNAMLLTAYATTRNPALRDALRQRLQRTPDRIHADAGLEASLKSPGAVAYEKLHGKGSAQRLVSAFDPVTLLGNLFLAGGLIKGAVTGAVEGMAAKESLVRGATQTAAVMGGLGGAGAVKQDPAASAGTLLKATAEGAATGALFHTAAVATGLGIGAGFRALMGKGDETANAAPEGSSAQTVIDVEGTVIPPETGAASNPGPGTSARGNPADPLDAHVAAALGVEEEPPSGVPVIPEPPVADAAAAADSAPEAPGDASPSASESAANQSPSAAVPPPAQSQSLPAGQGSSPTSQAGDTAAAANSKDYTLQRSKPGTLKNGLPVELRGDEPKGFTNTSLAERARQGGFVQLPQAMQHGVDLIRQGVTDFAQWSVAMVKKFGEAVRTFLKDLWDLSSKMPRFTNLKEIINGWSGRTQAMGLNVQAVMREIEKRVKDPKRREAITNWIQAGGDDTVLQAREAASKPPYKDGYRAARNLTPDELAMAQKVRQYYADALTRAQSHGLVDQGLADYVNQVWRLPWGQLARNFMFGKKRTIDSFFDGEQAGLTPVTKDISKLLGIYLTEMGKTIATREMIARLTKGAASDGRPLAIPEGGVVPSNPNAPDFKTLVLPGAKGTVTFNGTDYETRDYHTLENAAALAKWKFVSVDTDGKPVLVLGRLALHPEAYKDIKNALGKSAITEWAREEADSAAGYLARTAVRAGDAAQGWLKATMMSLSPFHIVQEGTHAIGHKVNPFANIPAVDPSNPAHVRAMNHGLMLSGDRVSMDQFIDGVGSRGGLADLVPGLRTLNRAVTEFTFEHYIPGLKLKTYEHVLKRNLMRFDKEIKAGTHTLDDVEYLSAKQTNAAYGHQNYKDMGRNPTYQHLLRMLLLAPDFLEARAKFTAQALQGLAGGKFGREQAAALLTLAVTFYVGARVMNGMFNNGDMRMDMDHLFGVQIGNRIYSMRSVPEDLYRLFESPRKFAMGRVSPVVGHSVLEWLTGVNYRGEKVTGAEQAQDLLANGIPMTVRMLPGLRDLTRTQKNHPVSPWEQYMGALGVQVGRHSPIMEMQKQAHAFKRAMGEEERGSYPVSQYQQLRYALEDMDWDKAKAEIKKLIGTSGRYIDLRKHFKESLFQPWTKSKQMDAQWEETMKPEQKQLLQHAEERRDAVWDRFIKVLGEAP